MPRRCSRSCGRSERHQKSLFDFFGSGVDRPLIEIIADPKPSVTKLFECRFDSDFVSPSASEEYSDDTSNGKVVTTSDSSSVPFVDQYGIGIAFDRQCNRRCFATVEFSSEFTNEILTFQFDDCDEVTFEQ